MTKQKTKLLLIFSSIFFVSMILVSCNSKEEKTETKDTTTVVPVKIDTTHIIDTMKMDSGDVKPTPTPN